MVTLGRPIINRRNWRDFVAGRYHVAILAGMCLFVGWGLLWMYRAAEDRKSPVGLLGDESHPEVRAWFSVSDFDQNLAVFKTVFWDPRDTISLRERIASPGIVSGKRVLEIGTGSGLLSLCCLKAGASEVVATDINDAAVRNARFNAQRLGLQQRFTVRQVAREQPGAYSVIGSDEQFDFIISNPPWVNRRPESIDEFALYDENFELMKSLFAGLDKHLAEGGRVWLAYGCVDAIRTIEQIAGDYGYQYEQLDERDLGQLSDEFLPGMLVEIKR